MCICAVQSTPLKISTLADTHRFFTSFHLLKSSPNALDDLGINKVMVCRVNQWQPGQWVTIYSAVGSNWIKSGTAYDPKFELTSGL